MADATRTRPLLNCDIVMKGGITSGVVYPLAITELAKMYRFRNIGGTSAGAIAAAATAAAEHNRLHGNGGTGFDELAKLPRFLSAPSDKVNGSTLFALFQPDARTLPLFHVATAGLEAKGLGRFWKTLNAALTGFAGSAALGALTGTVLAIIAALVADGWARVVALIAAVLLALVGAAVGLMAGIALNAVRELPRNRFGMCSGAPSPAYPQGTPALTPWMAELYNRVAGLPVPAVGPSASGSAAGLAAPKPLTFGDLWQTSDPHAEHETELQFITTNLTHGRPHRLPYDTTNLFFRPDELRGYFPNWVVDWMVAHPRKPKTDRDGRSAAPLPGGFVPMPDPADLPVVVAARLSLSFPFLISAVPFHAIDFTRVNEKDRVPERCWFSDGGLCSNFPVHFFDSPLPGWPTFDIGLRDEHPDHPVLFDDVDEEKDRELQRQNSRVVSRNSSGIAETWNRFDGAKTPLARLAGFSASMIFTAKDWHDNMQTRVPGYRDRIVQVSLTPDEGGLNLSMPPARIRRLGERGRLAAEKLGTRFSPAGDGSPMTWDNHRWVRFRTTLRLIEESLREVRETMSTAPEDGRIGYDALVHADPLPSYRMSDEDRDACLAWVGRLLNDPFLAQTDHSFSENPPRPRPVLRIVPPI
ncbi:MAG TPA: patatin-like phospholipase family protein [Longimicrobium sp.]|nr:patatin-like phospholipase family protein [Longimicrobium sp.]